MMSLKEKVEKEIVTSIKSGDKIAKIALRSLKAAIVFAESEKGANGVVSEEREMQILNKMLKQRSESASIYSENGRKESSEQELAEAKILSQFLPKQMSEDEVREVVLDVIKKTSAGSMRDMGKVMGMVNKVVAGKASGQLISEIVKGELC